MINILIIEDEIAIAELEKDYLELNDFEVMVEDVLEHAYNNERGIENMFDSDYKDCDPEMIGEYINVYREQMNSDYNRMYTELKEKMERGNEILNKCTQLYTKYKQGM